MTHPLYHMPTVEECDALSVGDLAPDPWGRMREVTKIRHRGNDINGNRFVGYTVRLIDGAGVTMSFKEGHLTRHVCLNHTAAELREIEARMRDERGHMKPLGPLDPEVTKSLSD